MAMLLMSIATVAQDYPPSGLEDNSLRTWLKSNWYDGFHSNLSYSNARKAMYDYIDEAPDGDVYCVYSGFHQDARNVSFLDPINAEHTVPQSIFNEALPMRSDIHHLFPTHMDVNSARGSLPFGDVNDASTDRWYIVNSNNSDVTFLTSTPSSNIDAYSELNTNSTFEVKEDHKGNTARAVFYFYTMYPNTSGGIERVGDLDELYQWHLDDPVDDWERQRNTRTAERQGNRNPYIDHPELVALAWGFDDPTPPTVSFSTTSGTIAEGNSGTTTYQITIAASKAPSADITLDIALDGTSTATSSADFTLSTTSLTLSSSDFSKTISISVIGDMEVENDETIVLNIQNLSGDATLGEDTHTLTITNDDTAIATDTEVSFSIETEILTTKSQGTVLIQLAEVIDAASSIELFITTTNGLVNGTDFSTTPSSTTGTLTLSIPAQTSQISFDVSSLNDKEGDVTFTILSTSANLSVGTTNSFTLNIFRALGLEEDLAAAGISIFPNPAKEGVFIQQEHFQGKPFEVNLYNLTGTLMQQQDFQQNDVFYAFPKLESGMYILQLVINGKRYFKRIIVQE